MSKVVGNGIIQSSAGVPVVDEDEGNVRFHATGTTEGNRDCDRVLLRTETEREWEGVNLDSDLVRFDPDTDRVHVRLEKDNDQERVCVRCVAVSVSVRPLREREVEPVSLVAVLVGE